jgi:hypothetical protein
MASSVGHNSLLFPEESKQVHWALLELHILTLQPLTQDSCGDDITINVAKYILSVLLNPDISTKILRTSPSKHSYMDFCEELRSL